MKQLFAIFIFIALTGCNSGTTTNPAVISASVTPLTPGQTVSVTVTNSAKSGFILNPSIYLESWLSAVATNKNLNYNGSIAAGSSHVFSFYLESNEVTKLALQLNYQNILTNSSSQVLAINAQNISNSLNPVLDVIVAPNPLYLPLTEDILINADLWSESLEIMSAGYGFEGIEGVTSGESNVIAAGGAWETILTANPPNAAFTTSQSPATVSIAFGYETHYADAMPIVFSWPVLPSRINRTDFAVTLNTGQIVTPYVASISPNLEYNERSTIVIFGEFGNRLPPGTFGAIYPVSVAIVDDGTPLTFIGPNGRQSGVGLSKNSTNPYLVDSGPTLVAAKLSVMSTLGEGIGQNNAFAAGYPNDGVAYYGAESAQYRLRIYTTGGFSPDGVAAVLPTDFATFFRLQLTLPDGRIAWITETGKVYNYPQGSIEVIGLADLGAVNTPINDAYVADRDNYIDIVLKGDLAAMRMISAVEIPATGAYKPFYNPGGPGNNPTPGVSYTTAGAYRLQPVTMALDNPRTVNYPN